MGRRYSDGSGIAAGCGCAALVWVFIYWAAIIAVLGTVVYVLRKNFG